MRKYLNFLLFFGFYYQHLFSENRDFIQQFYSSADHPFTYDLGIKLISANPQSSNYMLCFHGSGANNKIADLLQSYNVISDNLISFNFPDHDKDRFEDDPKLSTFGTIQELLPALYILKNLIIDGELKSINLYGFSAGGGVIVNILAILADNRFEEELKTVGITQENKLQIISVIENGLIILDCPLKSFEEIIALRGGKNKILDNILQTYASRYKENNLRPIDSIICWKNYKLNILLYFEVPDEKLSNRDDELYVGLIRKHNLGITQVITGFHGGHCAKHEKLWEAYAIIDKEKKS